MCAVYISFITRVLLYRIEEISEKNRGKNGARPFCTSDPLRVQRSTFVKKKSVIDIVVVDGKREREKIR